MRHQWTTLIPFPASALFGAEDDEGDKEEGSQEEPTTDDGDEKTFSQDYVDKLRKEAADRRVKAKDTEDALKAAQDELAKIKKAEMDDIERLQTELAEAQTALAEASDVASSSQRDLLNERIRNSVYRKAVEAGFQDPEDALSMIAQDAIVEDGVVDETEIGKQLKKLADKKPYLLKSAGSGSGDGGAGRKSGSGTDPKSFDGKVEKYKTQLSDTGRVSA